MSTLNQHFQEALRASTCGKVGYRVGRNAHAEVAVNIFPLHTCDRCGELCVIDEGVDLTFSPDAAETDVALVLHKLGAVQHTELNHGGHAENAAEFECDSCSGLCGYKTFYKGRELEVYAADAFTASRKAAELFKARKAHEVAVVLCERADGSTVGHSAGEF